MIIATIRTGFASVLILVCALFAPLQKTAASPISGFDDILFWVGSGPNSSAIVIDFQYGGSGNSTRQSFVWGYRWSGNATGQDMLAAVVAADPFLDVDSTFFVSQIDFAEGANTYSRIADYFVDFTSWGYYIAGGSATIFDSSPPYGPIGTLYPPGGGTALPTSWTYSPAGSADRQLADGSWDAWSFGNYNPVTFDHEAPPSAVVFAAVPEPQALALLSAAGILLAAIRLLPAKSRQ